MNFTHINVVGTKYRNSFDKRRLCEIAPSFPLSTKFEPEPANRHDPHAIRVVVEGTHAGYVPGQQAVAFAKFLAANPDLVATAQIMELAPGEPTVRVSLDLPTQPPLPLNPWNP